MSDLHDQVLRFWFTEIEPSQWWQKDVRFDAAIGTRFGSIHSAAAKCELFAWRATPRGRLAEIIVLDQFSRNTHRGSPAAFANDPLALALAQEAVRAGHDKELTVAERNFLYMPYMHSESRLVHESAASLFAANGDETTIRFECLHREIIERFGRYPHRNDILGRETTQEERAFLAGPNSSF